MDLLAEIERLQIDAFQIAESVVNGDIPAADADLAIRVLKSMHRAVRAHIKRLKREQKIRHSPMTIGP